MYSRELQSVLEVECRAGGMVGRGGTGLAAAFEVGAEVEPRGHRQLRHHDVARDGRGRAGSDPVQLCIRGGTDAGWITQAHFLSDRRNVETELLVVARRIAFQIQSSATG